MTTYTVTYWLDDDAHTDTVEAESGAQACADVQDRFPQADVWGARPELMTFPTGGQKPSQSVLDLIEGGHHLITFSGKGFSASGPVRRLDDKGVGIFWYNKVYDYPWSTITSVSALAQG